MTALAAIAGGAGAAGCGLKPWARLEAGKSQTSPAAVETVATSSEAGIAGAASAVGTPAAISGRGPSLKALTAEERSSADRWAAAGWRTDFSKKIINLEEVLSGGPPRDGIPPLYEPKFVQIAEADEFLKEREPVIAFEHRGEARAYPLQILTWHEIANDVVRGDPVLVTFCPLCNTALSFSRLVDAQIFRFGTSGKLRESNLVMWDRETESWWQQATGEAIVGEMTGKRLDFLPSAIVSWKDFKGTFSKGMVLSRETGHSRSYGSNPYDGYDSIEETPFLFSGEPDPRLRPVERVVTVTLGTEDSAYPYTELEKLPVVQDVVGGREIVVFWAKGTASALDANVIAESRDVGATGVFVPVLDGMRLSFKHAGGQITDRETGSVWNVLGHAVSGPLAGKRLEAIAHGDHFWFSWAAFKPDTRIWRAARAPAG